MSREKFDEPPLKFYMDVVKMSEKEFKPKKEFKQNAETITNIETIDKANIVIHQRWKISKKLLAMILITIASITSIVTPIIIQRNHVYNDKRNEEIAKSIFNYSVKLYLTNIILFIILLFISI